MFLLACSSGHALAVSPWQTKVLGHILVLTGWVSFCLPPRHPIRTRSDVLSVSFAVRHMGAAETTPPIQVGFLTHLRVRLISNINRIIDGLSRVSDGRVNGLVGQLAARRPQVALAASLGVYRSVNGLIGLLLGVSWITNNWDGFRKCQWFLYLALHSQ